MGFHQNTKSSANPLGAPTTTAGAVIRTPHLDALASAGVRLENYYVQPVCKYTSNPPLLVTLDIF